MVIENKPTKHKPSRQPTLTEKFLDDWLEDKHYEATERLREGKHTHEDLTIIMLKHQTNHINHLEKDLRGDIAEVRSEVIDLRSEIGSVRDELRSELRSEIGSVRTEFHSEMTDLRKEVKSEMTDLRKEVKSEMTDLRKEVKALTWRFITAMGVYTTMIGAFIAMAKLW